MSRLIDVDKLNFEGQHYNKSQMKAILDFIDNQPTAFNVDKVVEQLEKSHFHTDATFDDDGCCNDDSEEVVNLNEAIEIIRGGEV